MKITLKILFLLILFASNSGCRDRKKEEAIEPGKISVSTVTKIGEISVQDLRNLTSAFGFSSMSYKINYDVIIGKIEYETTYKNKKVKASGLIYFPKSGADSVSMLCFNHGTTFRKADAPSLNGGLSGAEFVAASGYVTVMPDYLGYGSSSQIFHPYYDETHSASVVIDIIRAGRKEATNIKIPLKSKVFIAGYSEGGYVSLAAQKAIEQKPDPDWKLVAVAAGAGGFDLAHMLSSVTAKNHFSYPAYLAFIIKSFNYTYDWNKPMSYFFQPKYAKSLDMSLDGINSGNYVNSGLTNRLDSLFTPSFYTGIKSSGEHEFRAALVSNSLTDWTPLTPTRIYHGTADSTVPYTNSVATIEKLKANGTKSTELIPINGGSHGSSFIPMIQHAFPWFEQLNK